MESNGERGLLHRSITSGSVQSTQDGKWGRKYVVAGAIQAPDGGRMDLSTVWIVSEDAHPMFVTAYPWRGRTV